MKINRTAYLERIKLQFDVHPVCALLGARQVGKTTLAKQFVEIYFPNEAYFFDLENPKDLSRLENPMLTLQSVTQRLIVIDEVQLKPDLFPILRVLVDTTRTVLNDADLNKKEKKFLILGSASRDLIKQSSETLAGRIGYIELPPFSLAEVKDTARLLFRGGFPNSYLAQKDEDSYTWRYNYIKTFLERDIPSLGFNIPAQQMRRFWLMLVHYHGQIFNASEIARSLGISDHTVRKYLDVLAGTFMIRILLPWFENVNKRQVKSPKIYFRDIGILNALLDIEVQDQLYSNPRLGAFWEGFVLEQILTIHNDTDCFFWSTQSNAELDLFIIKSGKRIGFEIKYTDAPKITKSMRIAQQDLSLDHLIVIYPGNELFPLADNITAQGLETLPDYTIEEII